MTTPGRKHAHNNALRNDADRARTDDLCVERHERICADMARLASLAWRHSVRAFGARGLSSDRQIWRRRFNVYVSAIVVGKTLRIARRMTEDPDEPIGYGAIVVGASGR
jgi:hypothetical protein